ncbi:MAG: 30S ribosomal protein S3 [Ruminococcus sp.]|nr:30S ribosomal protein S3 [Candidatus Apopatosoma intestinale]
MGQKVNPHGLRVGVIKDWDSRWFARDDVFGDTLVSDYKVRKYLKETLLTAGVSRIEIERTCGESGRVKIIIHCAKPGMVIGRGGVEIEKLRQKLETMTGKPVSVEATEIKVPDLDAQLVAESIAAQLEKRVAFRRAMKQAIGRTMRLGAKGIKVTLSGRLAGAEIARTEHYHEGTIPLQTIRADINYGFYEANTTYGKIGVKVWIYKGEVLADRNGVAAAPAQDKPRFPRRNDRGEGRRNDRGDRNGNNTWNGDRRPRTPRTPREGGAK